LQCNLSALRAAFLSQEKKGVVEQRLQEEQQLKVERSGVERLFRQVLVVQEKDVNTYKQVSNQLQLNPKETWMIGNSPRSDINPALAAGLNAIYIPHPRTWHLEHEEVVHVSRWNEEKNLYVAQMVCQSY